MGATRGIPRDRSGHLLVLCLSAGGMSRRAGAAMSALDRSDAEQPILLARQAVLEPRTVVVSLLRINSDVLVVASNCLELKVQSGCNVC